MSDLPDSIRSVNESVSTVFRHILPGILIITMSSLSIPSWLTGFNLTNSSTLFILAALAMVIGNAWYVFHRYCFLQVIDFIAYYFKWPGKPVRTGKSNFREDIGKHVSRFFADFDTKRDMGKHIRDRFSSFNYMFIASEALFVLTLCSQQGSYLAKWRWFSLPIACVGFVAALWQYMIVRCIDAEFVDGKTK